MYTDAFGKCKDICGDGRTSNENICDDGNTGTGDGCDSECKVEPNFYCRGGYFGKSDTCFWITTDFKNI
jgi:cysteine-rich repeat protein